MINTIELTEYSKELKEELEKDKDKDRIKTCELFNICNCKTAICRVALPDEGCYYYRYFKKLIEENENEN